MLALAATTSGAALSRPLFEISGTSEATRGLVSSLTAVVNALGGQSSAEAAPRVRSVGSLEPAQVLAGLEKDLVENEYLWSGKITAELYGERCTFTDPTLSFSGLSTFETNLANLGPWINRFVSPTPTHRATNHHTTHTPTANAT
jgi:hypothetical protein